MQQEQLYNHLIKDDDISWQAMIFDAVRSQQMNPWDINIGGIAEQFTKTLSQLKDMNFSIPGKVILASAILLKMKSVSFIEQDISALDRIIQGEPEQEYYEADDDDYEYEADAQEKDPIPLLTPRTPQPRTRKVSVHDLVKALEKALEVKNRRKVLSQQPAPQVKLPNKVFDLGVVMEDVYQRVRTHHDHPQREDKVMFSHLLESEEREDKVHTFVPLLHLSNMRKLDLHQEQHFGDIHVELISDQKTISQDIKELE